MQQIIEIVDFKLLAGVEEHAFLREAERSQTLVSQLAGFLYRSLSFNEVTQSWTDTVYWQTLAEAKSANDAFWAHKECQTFMAYIDSTSVQIQHQMIKMNSECPEQ